MLCKKCKSEWRTDQSISTKLVSCPFCSESLIDEAGGETGGFCNSKETLAFIAEHHGCTALLSKKVKTLFPDYAPHIPKRIKNLVYAVYDNGAAAILRENIDSVQDDKEIAIKHAVSLLTEAFIDREAAVGIINEFAAALGWHVGMAAHEPQAVHKNGEQSYIYQANTGIAAKIKRGEQRFLRFGEYCWRVLEVLPDRALLITEDIIEKRPYNVQYTDVTWEACSLRRYLNGEFMKKFSNYDRLQILESYNANNNNQWYAVDGGNKTLDKAFLLSADEVVKYFGDSGQLANWKPGNLGYIHDKLNDERSAKYNKSVWWWWLRTPGNHAYNAANVSKFGHIIMNGNYVENWEGGVRPVIWINLNIKSYYFYRN